MRSRHFWRLGIIPWRHLNSFLTAGDPGSWVSFWHEIKGHQNIQMRTSAQKIPFDKAAVSANSSLTWAGNVPQQYALSMTRWRSFSVESLYCWSFRARHSRFSPCCNRFIVYDLFYRLCRMLLIFHMTSRWSLVWMKCWCNLFWVLVLQPHWFLDVHVGLALLWLTRCHSSAFRSCCCGRILFICAMD